MERSGVAVADGNGAGAWGKSGQIPVKLKWRRCVAKERSRAEGKAGSAAVMDVVVKALKFIPSPSPALALRD